ncbi:MAG: acyl carrier protein [Armatimonadetes bacterium]|nr:acyl carrier protein [Armatimonadota bacterium]
MSDSTFERVKAVIVDQLKVSADEVTRDVSFADLNADSLAVVEMVMAFEEEFAVEIPDEEAEKLKTVGQAVEYIEAKMAE